MSTSRIIALVDMDCFYVQVEERDDPSIKGKPAAVVQYKSWKGGGLIAVNYEARAVGVGRHMRGDEAKAACPEIILVRVPETRGKADLTKYRDAGRQVINVLSEFSPMVERASVDEAYIDLTEIVDAKFNATSSDSDMFLPYEPQSLIDTLNMKHLEANFIMGQNSTDSWLLAIKTSEILPMDQLRLALGAEIVGHMRQAVYDKTGFRCSAGIAHNKVLAKLACGINKPNKQTVLPHDSVPDLWKETKVKKVRNLGGKLGDHLVDTLHCENMIDLLNFTEKQLASSLGSKTASWLYQLARGYDDELVTPRQLAKSVGCNKNFLGPEALTTKDKTRFWINQLSSEVVERVQKDLETNNRKAKVLTLHVKFENQNAISRSCGLPNYNAERMANDVYMVVEKLYQTFGVSPINSLGLIASKFEDELDVTNYGKINNYFSSVSNLPHPEPAPKKQPMATSIFKQFVNTEGNATATTSTDCNLTIDSENSSSSSVTNGDLSPEDLTEANTNPTDSNNITDAEQISPRKAYFTFKDATKSQNEPKKLKMSPVKIPTKAQPPPTDNDCTNETSKTCERCGKSVFIWDLLSHADYHFAKDLSREINGLPSLSNNPPSNSNPFNDAKNQKKSSPKKRTRGGGAGPSSSGAKRGRGSKSISNAKTAIKTKTLDSYFTPKT